MKHLRTFLYFEGNEIANETLIYAALSNGGVKDNSLGINGLFAFAMSMKIVGREDETQVERIGENTLHIDAKINGVWENVLCVEEVEVFQIAKTLDEIENEN